LYLRIGQNEALHFEHPAQFFSYAARAMRHLLTNRARDRLRLRAGGQWMKVTLDEDDVRLALDTAAQALTLDAALNALEQTDARAARVVELHYFAGLGLQQIADTLGLARRTIDRDWRFARAFLKAHMDWAGDVAMGRAAGLNAGRSGGKGAGGGVDTDIGRVVRSG